MGLNELRREFRTPPEGYGLAPFWFWNDDLKKETIAAQIAEMHDKNVREFMIHGRKGLSVEYLSDEWFDRIGCALTEAKKRGMSVWIYDEDNWPSGYAGEKVIRENPDFHGKCLKMIGRGDPPPPKAKLVATVGGKCFFQYAVPWNPAYSESLYIDNLNRKSTETFIRFTHQEYFNRFGEYFGDTIKGFFTDEPGFFTNLTLYPPKEDYGAITWTDDFPAFFQRAKGYDIIPHLERIWEPGPGDGFKYRMDYYDVMGQMYRENFFKPMRDFCEAHGVKLVGHVNYEEYLPHQVRMQGDLMKVLAMMHYSGVDRIDYNTAPKQAEKYASSTQHVYGMERTLVELYALSGWGLNLKTVKRWANHQFVRGINKIVPHAFYMSIEEDRKWECPPSLFLQNHYWKYFRQIADFTERMSWLLTRGKHVCPAAVYYPITTHHEIVGVQDLELSEKLDRLYIEACERLIESQIDFDIVNDDAIAESKAADGQLELANGDERYRVVLLVGLTNMPLATAEKLAAFAQSGGLVILVGETRLKCADPAQEAEFQSAMRSVAASGNYRPIDKLSLNMRRYYGFGGVGATSAIHARRLEDVRLKRREPAVKYMMREYDGARIYYFINESDAVRVNTAKIADTGAVYRFDPYSGEILPYARCAARDGSISIELEFTPWGEQVFLVTADKTFARASVTADDALRLDETGDLQIILRGDWEIAVNGETAQRPLADWADMGMPDFSGFVRYRKTFKLAFDKKLRYTLDLGTVFDCAEVTVNGTKAADLVWDPYRCDVTALLRDGENTIETVVCNTLGNELMLTRSDIRPEDYSFPSGLIGPVKIIAG